MRLHGCTADRPVARSPAPRARVARLPGRRYTFRMHERNGVRIGQRVRDLDGNDLGRVTRLYEQGFAAMKGFPILFRKDIVARYDEVRGVRNGEIVLARSARDLEDLAAGEVPPSWRVPVPPDFPPIATPPEARLLFEELARRGPAIGAPDRPVAGRSEPAPEPEPGFGRGRGRGGGQVHGSVRSDRE